jgi:hypothetical protein
VKSRTVLRTAALALAVPLTAVLASPASAAVSALNRDNGDDPGPGLSAFQTVGLYILIPLGIFLLAALLVYAPSSARGPRYRPGLSWFAAPVWFNGPGASAPAGTAPVSEQAGAGASAASRTSTKGGASARW